MLLTHCFYVHLNINIVTTVYFSNLFICRLLAMPYSKSQKALKRVSDAKYREKKKAADEGLYLKHRAEIQKSHRDKVKTTSSQRDKRTQRKDQRDRMRTYRAKKKAALLLTAGGDGNDAVGGYVLQNATGEDATVNAEIGGYGDHMKLEVQIIDLDSPISTQRSLGASNREKNKAFQERSILKSENLKLKRCVWRLQKRLKRMKPHSASPSQKALRFGKSMLQLLKTRDARRHSTMSHLNKVCIIILEHALLI
jgi:hypothetical protein